MVGGSVAQQGITKLSRRKHGFTAIDLAKECGRPGNHCGPFVRSIKAALKEGAIIATTDKRAGKVVYVKNPEAPRKKRRTTRRQRPSRTMDAKAVEKTLDAMGGDKKAGEILGDLFEAIANVCRSVK